MNYLKNILLCLFALTMVSCSNKIDRNIEKLQKMEAEYVQACNKKDYDKAREIVDNMELILNVTNSEIDTELAKLEAKATSKHGRGHRGKLWDEYRAVHTEFSSKVKPLADHKKYINDKEIYSILAKPSPDGNRRILYLYNFYDADQLPDMNDVVEVAISMGQEELVKNLIKSGVKLTEKNAELAKSFDMEEVVNMMEK